MITFGLTGGIASGKSTVTKTFLRHGIPMVDADIVARQVVEPGTIGLSQIIAAFGSGILLSDFTLDRAKLADLVFCSPDVVMRKRWMNKLNSIMTPLIHQESLRQIQTLHDAGHAIVGYDAALIIEQGNADLFRPLIVVGCHQSIQIERLMSRNKLTVKEAMCRIEVQLPLEEKINVADYVVDTSGSIDYSIEQTELIIKLFKESL